MFRKILSMFLSIVFIVVAFASVNVFALNDDVDMDMGEDAESYQTFSVTNLSGKYKTQGRTSIVNKLLMVDYSRC